MKVDMYPSLNYLLESGLDQDKKEKGFLLEKGELRYERAFRIHQDPDKDALSQVRALNSVTSHYDVLFKSCIDVCEDAIEKRSLSEWAFNLNNAIPNVRYGQLKNAKNGIDFTQQLNGAYFINIQRALINNQFKGNSGSRQTKTNSYSGSKYQSFTR